MNIYGISVDKFRRMIKLLVIEHVYKNPHYQVLQSLKPTTYAGIVQGRITKEQSTHHYKKFKKELLLKIDLTHVPKHSNELQKAYVQEHIETQN